MVEVRKRIYDLTIDDDLDGAPDLETHHRQRPFRRTKKHEPSSTFVQLDNYYSNVHEIGDILEDYRSDQNLKNLTPLVLDTSDGTWIKVDQHVYGDLKLKPGSNVSLADGTFLRVKQVLMELEWGYIVLRGYRFVSTACLQPILDDNNDTQELFWDLFNVKGSPKSVREQSLIDVPLRMVKKIVNIYLCNGEKPDGAGRNTYFCRWKLTRSYLDIQSIRRSVELAIETVLDHEADEGFRIPDHIIKINWRGASSHGLGEGYIYTALDGFCCSGGWSRGASMAGSIKVVRSFDLDDKACRSYGCNFPDTNCLNIDVFDYCSPQNLSPTLREQATTPEYVDIAHYSTPCQYFSPAHTRPGQADEKNFAASFCLTQLLDKDRPRVVTFENTSGLEQRHFRNLKRIFGQVTSRGYSLRFATLNLADWGIPQDRKRLIMLASCPGEPLPTFPVPTHSKNGEIPGTLPWVTIFEVIRDIPFEGWQNHYPSQMKKTATPSKLRAQAYTITCRGGNGECHPDGRKYTICEYQLLQGFPLHHRFAKGLRPGAKLGQIGNAFPPLFVKKLVRHIRRQLQATDGLQISIDKDDFLSTEELREQEIEQFFLDNENIPEKHRETIQYIDTPDHLEEDALDMEEIIAKEEGEEVDLAQRWGWITSSAPSRPSSSSSNSGSNSFSLQNLMARTEEDPASPQLSSSSSSDRQSPSSPESSTSFYSDFELPDFSNYNPVFFHPPLFSSKTALPSKSSISALSARRYELPGRGAYPTISMPIRRRRSSRSRSPSPDALNSTYPNLAQSGGSMEDAIELD